MGYRGLLAVAGLWRRPHWARPLAMTVAALNALSALPGMVFAPTAELAAGSGATAVGMAVVVALVLLPASRDSYAVLARLDRRLALAIPPESVLPTIVETVATALTLPYAAITLVPDGSAANDVAGGGAAPEGAADTAAETSIQAHPPQAHIVVSYGSPAPTVLHLPLIYGAEIVGHLHLAPRAAELTFSAADRRLLADLAAHAGVVVHTMRLTTDLRRSRERLVSAREEERRRLRRDLHDGLGPTMASLSQRLDAAALLVARDPPAALTLLRELKGQVKGTVAEIRRLVYALRPPALDEYGLLGALRAQAASHEGTAGLRVTLAAPEALPPLPAAVEVAAYRIAVEALTNVTRHAGARTCSIRLDLAEVADALCLEIVDDGVGLPTPYQAGVGIASMRERAAEVGGVCAIEAGPTGGTRVWARLPLGQE